MTTYGNVLLLPAPRAAEPDAAQLLCARYMDFVEELGMRCPEGAALREAVELAEGALNAGLRALAGSVRRAPVLGRRPAGLSPHIGHS